MDTLTLIFIKKKKNETTRKSKKANMKKLLTDTDTTIGGDKLW